MKSEKLLQDSFDVTLLLKALDGGLEIVGGLLLALVNPATLSRLIVTLTQHELVQDPHDLIANHILAATTNLHATQMFTVLYLLSHGVVKIVLVVGLFKKQPWAYPTMIAFTGAFMVYQIYRTTYTHSIGLILLTILDAAIIWLTWHEWQRIKSTSGV